MEEKQKLNKKELWINLKKSWKYAKNHKFKLFGYMFGDVFLCIISAIAPLLSAKIVLKLSDGLWNDLIKLAFIVFAVEIFRNIFHFLTSTLGQKFFRGLLLDLKVEVAKETLKIKTEEIDHNSSGVFIDRLNKDTGDIADVFLTINSQITDIITSVGVLGAVFVISKMMFIYYIITLLVLFFFRKKQMKLYFERNKKYRKLSEITTGITGELIRGIRDIRVLNANSSFMSKIKKKLSEANEELYKMSSITNKYNLITGSLHDLFDLGFILYGVILINKNLLTGANFVILYMYSSRVRAILNYSTAILEQLKKFNLAATRVYEVIDSDKFKKEEFGNKVLKKANGDFEFHDVKFSYDENREILKGINFRIKANETVAFVGESGSGKSTIFSLLNKLYDVNSGFITIDGIDIKELDKDSIRNNMSIITQLPYIFNFSIRDNIRIVKEDATDEEIENVCKIALLHDFIMSLPDGYDTVVGEGGLTLSGGQRQRLAIARALIKKTEIILFDEATSALDNHTQKEIQDAINNMRGEYTILIIAHRLSTVINSDRIIVINDGKVVDSGTHKELMKNCSIYKKLYLNELS